MLNRLLQIFFLTIKGKNLAKLSDDNGNWLIFLKFQIHKFYVYISLSHLVNVFLTLFIFFIFWKYDIQLITSDFINSIIYFNFIIYFILKFILGKKNKVNLITILISFFNFLLNLFIFIFIFKININVLLMYNISMYIYIYTSLMFLLQAWWLNWKFSVDYIIDFLFYPWVILIFCIFFLYLTKKNYFKNFYYIQPYCIIDELEIDLENENW